MSIDQPTLDAEAMDDPSYDEAAILRQALRQLESARRSAKEVNDQKDRAQLVYLGKTDPMYGKGRRGKRDWRSRYFPKVAQEHAELKIAEVCSDTPQWENEAVFPQDRPLAEARERVVSAYLDLDDFDQVFRTCGRKTVKYGDQTVMVLMRESYDGSPARATILPIGYEDFALDPSAKDYCSALYAWRRWYATNEDLRAAGIYKNLEDLPTRPTSPQEATKKPTETQEQYDARTTGVHEIWERWSPWGVLAIANQQTVIRHDEDPDDPIYQDREIPFERLRLVEDDDTTGGISTMLNLEADQALYWKYLNELCDAITLATRPPKAVDEDLDANAAVYAQWYPDMVLPTRGGNSSVHVFEDVTKLSGYGMQELIQMTRDHMERSSGMNASVAGMGNSSSASEATQNLAQSKTRIGMEIEQFDCDWARVIQKFWSRIDQYGDAAEVLRFSGGVPVQGVSFRGKFKSKLTSERALLQQRRNDLTSFWNALQAQIPPGSVEFEYLKTLIDEMALAFSVGDLGVKTKTADQQQDEQQQRQLYMTQAEQQIQTQGQLVAQQQSAQLQAQMADQQPQAAPPPPEQQQPLPQLLPDYEKAPPSVQRQMEQHAGFQPATATEGAAQLASMKPAPAKPGAK